MIYVNHNFAQNYLNAEAYDDKTMKSSILIDELGRNIVENKRKVVKMLRDRGVNVTYNSDNLILSKFVAHEIKHSPQFAKQMADLIVNNATNEKELKSVLNDMKERGNKYQNFTADEKERIKTTWEECYQTAPPSYTEREKISYCEQSTGYTKAQYDECTQSGVGSILGKIGSWFSSDNVKEKVSEGGAAVLTTRFSQNGEDELDSRIRTNEMKNGYKLKKPFLGLDKTVWIMLGVAVGVATIGFFAYRYVNKRKEQKAKGGNMSNNVAAPKPEGSVKTEAAADGAEPNAYADYEAPMNE